ncbi:MAG: dTMP kinase [Nanoarchaeota archaeon]|nr:dTMP kinase [Nanoarchaeota archaeon]
MNYYIMLEAGEGCGKDTQADKIIPWLQEKGYNVVRTKEPGGTPEAEAIRNILTGKALGGDANLDALEELHLFSSARASNYRHVVIPYKQRAPPEGKKGNIILKTRGWPSTIAYQGHAGRVDLDLIKRHIRDATRGILPDLLLIIDNNPTTGLSREIDANRFAAKGLAYHQDVRKGYLAVAEEYPNISVVIPYVDGKIDEMQETIRRTIGERLGL